MHLLIRDVDKEIHGQLKAAAALKGLGFHKYVKDILAKAAKKNMKGAPAKGAPGKEAPRG